MPIDTPTLFHSNYNLKSVLLGKEHSQYGGRTTRYTAAVGEWDD